MDRSATAASTTTASAPVEQANAQARTWVPSPREQAAGALPDDSGLVGEVPRRAVSARRPRAANQGFRGFLAAYSPRTLAEGGPRLALVVFVILAAFNRWDYQALQIVAPDITNDFGISAAPFILLIGVGPALQLVIAPALGWWADRHSRLRLVQVGAPLHHLGVALLALARSLPLLFVFPLVGAIGGACEAPATLPLLTDYYSPRVRARVFSLLGMGGALGLASPLIAAVLDRAAGWRATLLIIGLTVAAVSLLLFLLKEPVRGRVERLDEGVPEDAASIPPPPPGWAESWRAAWSVGTVRRICYAVPFLVAAGLPVSVYLLFFMRDHFGLDVVQRGLLLSGAGIVGLIGLAFSGPFSDRVLADRPGRIFHYLAALLVLSGAATIALINAPSVWLAALCYLPIGGFGAMLEPAYRTLISRVVPVRIRAFGLQVISPWALAGFVIVPVIFSFTGFGVSEYWAIMIFSFLFFIGAFIIATAGGQVERDIRAAAAANEAEAEVRRALSQGSSQMLVVRRLDVAYGGAQVLFDVDLDIADGELVALLGTNGAGKSTLLRAIAGIQHASNGAIFYDGRDVTHRPPDENAAGGVVFLPGGRAVFPSLSVRENLRLAAWLYGNDGDYVRRRTDEMLERFPILRRRLDDRAGILSGGEQQMLALSQAFLMRPRLLMIDELSLGLAPRVVEELLQLVRAINQEGTTVILVEQSINVALTIAQRAIFMERGQIHFDGRVEELLARGDLVRSVFLAGAGSGARGPFIASGGPLKRQAAELPRLALEAEGVDVSFGGVHALSDVHLAVSTEEIVGIIGPNGAGKTTLFDVLSGYVQQDAGTVRISGVDMTSAGPDARARAGLGRSFQNARLFGSMTVRECIAVALERHLAVRSSILAAAWTPWSRGSERSARRRVEYLVDVLELGAVADKFVGELSTGSRRMVDIACVMAAEPTALLLDEPSSGLAQAEIEVLGPLVRRLVRQTGCGLVVIEHDISLITGLADRLLVMDLGTIIASGAPHDVINDPRVVQAYLGAAGATLQRSGPLGSALAAAGLSLGESSTAAAQTRGEA